MLSQESLKLIFGFVYLCCFSCYDLNLIFILSYAIYTMSLRHRLLDNNSIAIANGPFILHYGVGIPPLYTK